MTDTTTIRISKQTKIRLQNIMRYGETLDGKISDLLDAYQIINTPIPPKNEPKTKYFFD